MKDLEKHSFEFPYEDLAAGMLQHHLPDSHPFKASPHDFHAEEWYEVEGRGWVAATSAGRTYDRENVMAEIRAHGFTIDGKAYTLIAVERFMPMSPISPGEKIGLLVKQSPHS